MADKKFSGTEALAFGWETMKKNFGFFLAILIVGFIAQNILGFFAEFFKRESPVIYFLLTLGGVFLNMLVSIGILKIALHFCDNEPAQIFELFAYPELVLRFLGIAILSGLAVLGGAILLIVPGIILAIRLQYAGYLLVDKNTGVMEALKKSMAMTKGVAWDLFVLGCLMGLVALAGVLCLGVGLFAALPTIMVANAFVYRKLAACLEPGKNVM